MKIVSGGQTGVDRAALDFAIEQGMEHGGWCPHGRLAEDGPIPLRYHLRETDTSEYAERTDKNVVDSDATLIVSRNAELAGGTAFTHQKAMEHRRPVLVVCECDDPKMRSSAVAAFVKDNGVKTLNVAGPRESEAPGIGEFVRGLLQSALSLRDAMNFEEQ